MKSVGERIKELRDKKGLSQEELAARTSEIANRRISRQSLSSWESGKSTPRSDNLSAVAIALGVDLAILLDSQDTKKAPTNEGEGEKQNIRFVGDLMRVPVVSREMTACCGSGIGAMDVTSESEEPVWISRSELRAYDDLRPPFAIYADGDCLTSDDIKSEDKVIINPAEEAQNGSIVLVRMYGMLSLKRYYRLPNDTVVLRSDDGEQRLTPKKQEDADFTIIGVMIGFFRGRPVLKSF